MGKSTKKKRSIKRRREKKPYARPAGEGIGKSLEKASEPVVGPFVYKQSVSRKGKNSKKGSDRDALMSDFEKKDGQSFAFGGGTAGAEDDKDMVLPQAIPAEVKNPAQRCAVCSYFDAKTRIC